jgi:hypothetical protein
MKNQFSDLWSLNYKEVILGLLIVIGSALVDLLWSGINPIIAQLKETQTLDLALFTTKVNWETAWDTASVTAIAYFGIVFNTGNRNKK